MKKIFISLAICVFAFAPSVSAQTVTLPMPSPTLTPSPAPTSVNYELPYPGILPGSPLYIFKSIRDKISETLTTNPLRKSDFYLLQADKRLSGALLFYKQGDVKLADESLKKSQIYLEKSIDKLIEAKKSQENVSDTYAKIKSSSAKQKQEIEILLESVEGDEANSLQMSLDKAELIENRVNSFKP